MIIDLINVMVNTLHRGTTAMVEAVLSLIIGVDVSKIKKIFRNDKTEVVEKKEINDSIDEVTRKLEESKEILDGALKEMEKQKQLYEQMKKEAELSQQLSAMNEEQMSAVNTLLENTLIRQERKAFPKNIAKDLFFCILSALIGFLLGKYL